MLHCMDGISQVMSGSWFPPDVTLGIQGKKLNLVFFIRPENLPQLLSLAGRPGLGSFLVVPNFFHLRIRVSTVLFGTCKAAEIFLYPSPDLCLDTIMFLRSADNSFDPWLGVCSDMHCQLWDLI